MRLFCNSSNFDHFITFLLCFVLHRSRQSLSTSRFQFDKLATNSFKEIHRLPLFLLYHLLIATKRGYVRDIEKARNQRYGKERGDERPPLFLSWRGFRHWLNKKEPERSWLFPRDVGTVRTGVPVAAIKERRIRIRRNRWRFGFRFGHVFLPFLSVRTYEGTVSTSTNWRAIKAEIGCKFFLFWYPYIYLVNFCWRCHVPERDTWCPLSLEFSKSPVILWAWHVDVVIADLLYEGQPTDEFVVQLGSGSAKYTSLISLMLYFLP